MTIPLNRGFVGYAGWVLPYDRDLHLLTDRRDDSAVRMAARELAMIGLDRVAGWFDADAFTTWTLEGGQLVTLPQVSPEEVAGDPDAASRVVDVRNTSEWDAGHIPGATHTPLGRLVRALDDRPRAAPMVLVCESGSRSAIGASLLAANGFNDVSNLSGGMRAWQQAGLPVETSGVITSIR
jgi:hydroxyacylglutathione hydrolase